MKILIVDDQPLNLKLLRSQLEAEGHAIVEATDGVEALAILLHDLVDAIISDILMPHMDGFRFCSEVRRDERLQKVPFIFYTATYTSPSDEKLCYDLGADKYLRKPATVEAILNALNTPRESGSAGKISAQNIINENGVMKQYNEQLVLKLEKKNAELSAALAVLNDRGLQQRSITEDSGDVLFQLSVQAEDIYRFVSVNEAFSSLTGIPRDQTIGKRLDEIISDPTFTVVLGKYREAIREKKIVRWEETTEFPTGSLTGEVSAAPVFDAAGKCTHLIGSVHDITERKRFEAESRENQLRFQQIAQNIEEVFYLLDPQMTQMLYISHAYEQIWGRTCESLYADPSTWADAIHPDDRARVYVEVAPQGTLIPSDVIYRIMRPNGEVRSIRARAFPVHNAAGQVYRFAGIAQDITERLQVEAERNEHTDDLEHFRQLSIGRELQMIELKKEINTIAKNAGQAIPYDLSFPNTVILEGNSDQTETSHERFKAALLNMMDDARRSRDAAEQAFADLKMEVAERKQTEEKFLQSQKMEAIGRLSGGVAHDFNNLLTVILGNVNVLEMSDITSEGRESVEEIKQAGERAANLTRQLLLFARRESLQMRHIDLNVTIVETVKMLRRILGEDIHLDFFPTQLKLPVQADAGMLDQILVNLVVNARDAMPAGGELVIRTELVEFDEETAAHSGQMHPGTFALLSVKDSGQGIPADVLPKIFDPFFTTKDVGKGTGLGLATVFGIVQQHNGWINAYSEPAQGTIFRVYLPVVTGALDTATVQTVPAKVSGGRETILLVEDEGSIRTMVTKYLGRLGYEVLAAGNGKEAIQIFNARRADVELLMTDIVMPDGMNGVELAKVLIAEKFDLSVIYSSGYNEVEAAGDLILKETINFLTKPFSLSKLAVMVRYQLDLPKPKESLAHRKN